ncbi:MAG: helix-turn-helix domain-containing protein [Acidimicrobiales bacterium]
MESITVARSLRGSIGMLAMAWLLDESTATKAAALGLDAAGRGAYAVGRLGVLGDCPPDAVVSAAYFWEPGLMRTMVADGRAVKSPAEGAAIYTRICQEWGADRLAGLDGVERLGDILTKVVDTASPLGAPMFVGWRDMPRPTEPGPARTFQLAQVMRELRFSRHCIAIQAVGLGPLEAILSGPAGDWNAKMFGWPEPYPDTSSLTEIREEAEMLTDRLHAADLDILTDTERADLRELAKSARAHHG